MDRELSADHAATVVILVANLAVRESVVKSCAAMKMKTAVHDPTDLSEIMRGAVMVTDQVTLVPRLYEHGATHVLAVVANAMDGADAVDAGASGWLFADSSSQIVGLLAAIMQTAG